MTKGLDELRYDDFDTGTAEGREKFDTLREASKYLLAAKPWGLLRHAYLNSLIGDYRLALPREPKHFFRVVRLMPDIVHVRHDWKEIGPRDLVFPAYAARMIRGPRPLSDYDRTTELGRVGFRQLHDSLASMLEENPRWNNKTLRLKLHDYGHRLSREDLKELVEQMPELAKWHVSDQYEEYDAISLVDRAFFEEKKTMAVKSRGLLWRTRLYDRFKLWYDDPFPDPRSRKHKEIISGYFEATPLGRHIGRELPLPSDAADPTMKQLNS